MNKYETESVPSGVLVIRSLGRLLHVHATPELLNGGSAGARACSFQTVLDE